MQITSPNNPSACINVHRYLYAVLNSFYQGKAAGHTVGMFVVFLYAYIYWCENQKMSHSPNKIWSWQLRKRSCTDALHTDEAQDSLASADEAKLCWSTDTGAFIVSHADFWMRITGSNRNSLPLLPFIAPHLILPLAVGLPNSLPLKHQKNALDAVLVEFCEFRWSEEGFFTMFVCQSLFLHKCHVMQFAGSEKRGYRPFLSDFVTFFCFF